MLAPGTRFLVLSARDSVDRAIHALRLALYFSTPDTRSTEPLRISREGAAVNGPTPLGENPESDRPA